MDVERKSVKNGAPPRVSIEKQKERKRERERERERSVNREFIRFGKGSSKRGSMTVRRLSEK